LVYLLRWDRLRDALAYNGLTLDGDERLLARVLDGDVSSVQLAEAIPGTGRSRTTKQILIRRTGKRLSGYAFSS
jgi:hypothetical protein